MKKAKILIGVSASVAAIKLIELIDQIKEYYSFRDTKCRMNFEVKVILTRNSEKFITLEANNKLRKYFTQSMSNNRSNSHEDNGITPLFFGHNYDSLKSLSDMKSELSEVSLSNGFMLSGIYTDDDELMFWDKSGKVLHIMLKSWADLLLIAPLDANTLSKITNGMADNLLTCVTRAWPVGRKPLLVATAMNTDMYDHPLTRIQLEKLTKLLCAQHIEPISKVLACGEFGIGAMARVELIVECLIRALG